MRFALHFALAFYGEAPEVSYLIEASAVPCSRENV